MVEKTKESGDLKIQYGKSCDYKNGRCLLKCRMGICNLDSGIRDVFLEQIVSELSPQDELKLL